VLSSCESRIGSCTDDPGDGSITASAKPSNIFSNNSQDLWQTQLADWQETPYYTNGQDITVAIGTGSYGSVDAHRGQSGRVTHPCNICSKIVKYASNGKIEYQTPNCICGPKIYGPPNQLTQSFQYNPNSREQFRAIETIQPQCEIMPGYLEQAHYGIINANERVVCEKSQSNKIITVDNDVGNINPLSPMTKNLSPQQYTCIPMEWALNLGGVDNQGVHHPNFTNDSHIQSFLGKNILRNHLGVEKYYSKATYLLTADFKNIIANVDGSQQSGYEIVHFPVDYYKKELSQTESDKAKITQLKDVNYHQVSNCNASNGLSLYMGLFPPNSDMPGYNNKIYAYHLYSFNQICRSYYRGICNNAVTEFKLKSTTTSTSGLTPSASGSEVLPKFFSANNGSIPAGYKIKFKVYDNYYTDNNSSDGYLINITSGIQTQNTDNQQQDEGIIGNAKNKIDSIFIGADAQGYSLKATSTDAQQKIDEIIDSAKKNGLIRATYENFTRKNQLLIRLVMSLFLLFYAVSYLMGLSEMNQKELVVRVFKIAIVFAFLDPTLVGIMNGESEYAKITTHDPSDSTNKTNKYATLGFLLYQKYVVNFVLDGLNTLTNIVSGLSQQVIKGFTANDGADALQREGISFSQNVNFAYFDKILESIFNIRTVGSIISAFFTKLVVGALLLVVFLYFLVKTIFKLLITYILNWLQIILALSLGPIFFLFLLFSRTKSFFTKWLAFIFARGLDIVILLALTFPFLSVIYDDLLQLIGQTACLKAIGPSFLRIGVWFQGDSVNDEINNFFGYMFALARDIALVYMVNLIASYAPKISGKIINIAEQQNMANVSAGATKIASETTTEALKAVASSFKFANQSYVGGMTKSYLKQGALGASDFFGATRFAKFAKNIAVNTAQQAFKAFTNVVNAKNAKTAGTKLFDTAFNTNFSKQRGDASADVAGATGATPVTGADGGVPAGSGLAGGVTATGGAPAGGFAGAGLAGVPAGSGLAGVPAGSGLAGGVPAGRDPAGVFAGGVDGGGLAGGVPATVATFVGEPLITEVESSNPTSAPPPDTSTVKAYIDENGNELPSTQGPARAFNPLDRGTHQEKTAVAGVGYCSSGSGSAGGGASASGVVDDTNEGAAPQKPTQSVGASAEGTPSSDAARDVNVVGHAVAGGPPTHTIQKTTPAVQRVRGAGVWEVGEEGAGAGEDTEAVIRPRPVLQEDRGIRSAPPSNYSFVQQNIEKPANDQFKPEFLTQIKSIMEGGLDYLKREIANDLSLNNFVDLFIDSQNKTLRDLNAKFGQSGEESNIEKELQKAFEKFKQDFTSTQTTTSQFIQTTQSTQYQQEAEQLKTNIQDNKLTSEQQDKLRALATQNDQKDLAEKLQNNSKTLTEPQKKQLIKLVQQDLFAKQESQLVPKITATIIANDNQPISDEIKQKVFKQVADELKSTTAIQETTKQEVLTKFVTQLDEKNLDPAVQLSIAELKTKLQETTNTPAQQQILVQFLANKDKPQQAKEVVLKTLESIANIKDEAPSTTTPQERRNFFNEVKKEVAKEEVLEKFVTQLDDKTSDSTTKTSIAELKTKLQETTNTPAQQQILVQFLANKDKPQQAKEVVLKTLESIANAQDEGSSTTTPQERRNFFNEIKKEVAKEEILEKFVNQLNGKNLEDAVKPSIAQLKQELQTATSAPAQQQILVRFLAKADIPQEVKDELYKALESIVIEAKDPSQQQARQDFINEVKIAILATQLQDVKPVLEKQQILVQFLTNRTNAPITAKVETILQKIKEETEKEEEVKSPLKQERTDFIRKIEEQSGAIKTFAQYHNPEPKSDEISQEELVTLKQSKFLKDLGIKAEDLEYLTDRAGSSSEVDKILKDFSLYVNDDDFIKQALPKINEQDQQNLQDYAEKREEFLEKILQELSSVETGSQVDLSISVESIETQKKTFDAVLKLFGVKYKSDRDKCLSILFATQDTTLSVDNQIEKMYVNLEKPLEKMKKYDVLFEKILIAINDDLENEIKHSETQDDREIKENQQKIQKNKNTIKKLQARRKSFKSLFARIKKAIES